MWPFMLFTIFLALVSTTTASDKCCRELRLKPSSLTVVYGENVTIACSIVNQSLRRRYNASNLVFKFKLTDPSLLTSSEASSKEGDCNYFPEEEEVEESNETDSDDDDACNTTVAGDDPSNCSSEDLSEYDDWEGPFLKVNPSYVRAVNRYKARLEHPGLTKRYQEASLNCCLDAEGGDDSQSICVRTHILIGYRPFVPIVRPATVKNWDKLTFYWRTEKRNDVYTTRYVAWYKNFSSFDDFVECPMDEECTQSCEVNVVLPLDRDLSADSRMIFKVNASNVVGVATSPEVVVDLYDIVAPDPVHIISVTVVNFSACVKFKSPKSGAELIYELLFKCFGEPNIFVRLPRSNDSVQEKCVSKVPSYADCRVSMRAKPYSYGKWGERGNQTKFTMPQNVPLAAPDVCRSCFEVLSTDDHKAHIRIFPKPLPRALARGRVITYRASLTKIDLQQIEVSSSIEFSGDSLELDFTDLELSSNYSVAVVVATEAGYNDSIVATPVVVNLLAAKSTSASSCGLHAWPRNITAFIVNGTTVRMSWLCRHPKLTGFTVFWCRVAPLNQGIHEYASNLAMVEPMQWSHVPANVTRFEVTDLPAFYLQNYLFGVAVETADGYSSGVVWTKCLYNLSRVSGPPQVNSKVNGTKVQLNFSKSSECNAGFPYAYRVKYCPTSSENDTKCHDESSKESIVEGDSLVVHELTSNTGYLFMISSLSVAGPSLSNSIVKVNISGQDGSPLSIWVIVPICISVIVLFVVVVVIAVCRQRIKDWVTIRIQTPAVIVQRDNRSQPLASTDDSESYPDYAHINVNPRETFSDVHENGSALSNGWISTLDSSSDHLIPKNNNLPTVVDPPFRGRRCNAEDNDDDGDNASVASYNTSDNYTRTKLNNRLDVVPSSPPVEPIFLFDDDTDSCLPNATMDLGEVGDASPAPQVSVNSGGGVVSDGNGSSVSSCGYALGRTTKDLGEVGDASPAPQNSVNPGGGAVNDGNGSSVSSCGYALGRTSDCHSGPSRSTADGVSVEMPESGSGGVDAGNGCLPALLDVDPVDEKAGDAQNVCALLNVSVQNDSSDGSISGSNYDVTGDHLHPYSVAVDELRAPEEDDSRNDDGYNASVLSSSDYAVANFKNKGYDPVLDTPAADVICADNDDDDDSNEEGYAAVSLVNSKRTAYSTESLTEDTNISPLMLSMSS